MAPNTTTPKQKVKDDKKDSTLVDDTMAGAQLVLKVASAVPGIDAVPFLQPATKTVLSIIQTVETVRDNKADLKQTAKDAEELILVIYNAYETSKDKKLWPGKGLEDSLKSLILTLEKVERLAQRRAQRGVTGRFFTSIIDTKKIKEYRHEMEQARERFSVQAQLKANELLLRIEGHLDESVQRKHQAEQAKKEEKDVKQAKLKHVEEVKNEADAQARIKTRTLTAESDKINEELQRERELAQKREEELEKAKVELQLAEKEERKARKAREAEEKHETQMREYRERMEAVKRRQEDAEKSRLDDAGRRRLQEDRRRNNAVEIPPLSSPSSQGSTPSGSVSFFSGASGVDIKNSHFNVNNGRL